jgi:FixJ family two-component response regulator
LRTQTTKRYVLGMVSQQRAKVVAIVDDDELIRESLRGLMKAAGFPAVTFASGEEFLNSGEQENIACLIVDIRMLGMSGLELQSKLNKDDRRIPIIFITAHGDENTRMQALRAGAVKFLTKPVDKGVLIDSVRTALNI